MNHRALAAIPLIGTTLVALSAFPLVSVRAQKPSQPSSEANLLPAYTGTPVTVKLIDLPDIKCAVVEWNSALPKPTLTLLCPPEEIFAPLRVCIKLSWLKSEDVPDNAPNIQALPKTQTKVRTSKTEAWVWLKVCDNKEEQAQPKWVSFNGLMDVALLPGNIRVIPRSAPRP